MIWVILLLGAGVLQSTLFSRVTLFGVHPNLVFVVAFLWTIGRGGREGLRAALVGGLVLDLFSVTPFGTFTLSMLLVLFLVGFAERLPLRMTTLLAVLIMVLASFLFNMVAMVMMQSLGWQVGWGYQLALLPRIALVDVLLLMLLYQPMNWVSQRAGAPAIEWGSGEGRL